ncbi:DUF2971 domain-containing protein [Nonlabens ponticola]|uniref:DUF2971 domain-containing protein n=1 Tax=Nonlabens ponticola TaxID=2496866 RepID=A0A3S9MUD6_9FLAO|nr:DUF2971 domain-containing protein [Nonlabens ponticola]AZQ42789.1 DUF2971 domain-containing protein [Nonlabens ponticola]
MFKYCSINKYTLENLSNEQIYFSSPSFFNDPFDTFHPASVERLSDKIFVELVTKLWKGRFDQGDLMEIMNKSISLDRYYSFCVDHIDYIFQFDSEHKLVKYRSKKAYLNYLSMIGGNSKELFSEEVFDLLNELKIHLTGVIVNVLNEIRVNKFSKMGISCFSKNSDNLLMWSYYADGHKGICLEFDSTVLPFSKTIEVTYRSEIPNIISDLFFSKESDLQSLMKLATHKSIEWSHEEELRLLHHNNNQKYRYPKGSLKALYFGCKVSDEHFDKIMSIVRQIYPEVRLFKMVPSTTKFILNKREFIYREKSEK